MYASSHARVLRGEHAMYLAYLGRQEKMTVCWWLIGSLILFAWRSETTLAQRGNNHTDTSPSTSDMRSYLAMCNHVSCSLLFMPTDSSSSSTALPGIPLVCPFHHRRAVL